MPDLGIHEYRFTHLAVGAAQLADLQRGVAGSAGQRIPGVRAVGAPQHKQVVARRPEQQVLGARVLQRLRRAAASPFTRQLIFAEVSPSYSKVILWRL